ncbi:MAG TPA: PadR family transcriptional regulator [archaeon]|nr:PadR family transcriptional regulator [archaeon]
MYKFKGSRIITKTVILGMLAQKQMHGYEIKKRISEALGESADINFGSIYYGLKSLTAQGFVDHIGDEPGKGSPERSIYRITPKGRQQLKVLVEKSLSDTGALLNPVEVGLSFMGGLPASRVREILTERYHRLKASYETALTEEARTDKSSWVGFIREYRLYHLGAEVHWLKNLLPKLENI